MALLISECSQEELCLMRKYACVKVFSLIQIIINQSIISHQYSQRHYMDSQNQALQNIINTFISKSRKNSNDSNLTARRRNLEQPTQIEQIAEDQEFIIRTPDLREFVQKIAANTYEKNSRIQALEDENKQLKKNLILAQQKIGLLGQTNPSQSKEAVYKKTIAQIQSRIQAEKKRRQHLQKQVKWSNTRIKEQMKQIQRFKEIVAIREHQLNKLNDNPSKQPRQVQHPTSPIQQFLTPARFQLKKSQNPLLRPETFQAYPKSETVTLNKQDWSKRLLQTDKTKDSHIEQGQLKISSFQRDKVFPVELQQIGGGRFHRHSDLDRKDRLLRQLGEKCLFLQSHIEVLTKKILGYLVQTSPTKSTSKVESEVFRSGRLNRAGLEHIENEGGMFKVDID